ncbi:nuclear transport factor 2 family protein [Actinacidiphila acidipaludis]|uniref:Nuclear transport factor 2 family protein n=1 Tax=Actinacidiphila acidipaludis TaxID=2873382 RepID=A0ABS7QDK7_9ACTN|nr:nuclear transport factor 2 family protein [Streptomyces acidipaludis]MBY8881257.1 nuclear transport factor 2 family protein [Streptomyces acidipaludis]
MSDIQHLVERYIAAWNETDPAARRALIGEVFAADARYTDPLADVTGPDALDAVVGAVQDQFAGLAFTLGPVDTHHHVARFTWELGPAGGEALVIGFDVAVTGEDGLIHGVLGFLDKVPATG